METITFGANIWWDVTSSRESKIRMNDDDPDNVIFTFDKEGNLLSVEHIKQDSTK